MPRKFEFYDRTKRPDLKYPENTENYIEIQVHQEKKSTGPGIDDFEIIDVEEEIKTNIDEFINSFKDDVGIEAVMKRIALTGDVSLLNQKEAIHMDTTIIPEDPGEAFAMAQSMEENYAALDPKLTEGQSAEEFIKNLSKEKLDKYIDELVAEKIKESEGQQK